MQNPHNPLMIEGEGVRRTFAGHNTVGRKLNYGPLPPPHHGEAFYNSIQPGWGPLHPGCLRGGKKKKYIYIYIYIYI